MNEGIQNLYNYLKSKDVELPGSVEEFDTFLRDDASQVKIAYDFITAQGDVQDLPSTLDDFAKKLGVQKKSSHASGSPYAGGSPEQVARLKSTLGIVTSPFGEAPPNLGALEPITPENEAAAKDFATRDPRDNKVPYLSSLAGKYDKGAIKTLTAVPKAVAKGMSMVLGQPLEDQIIYKVADWVDKQVDEYVLTNPLYDDDTASQLMETAGVLTAFVMGPAMGRTSRNADLAIPTATKAVMNQVVPHLPTAFMAASGTAMGEYETALAKGATQKEADEVFLRSLSSGLPFLVSPTIRAFNKVTNGKFRYGMIEGVKGGIIGAFQLATAQVLSNVSAKEAYDETRGIIDGVMDAGGSGFAINGFLTGLIAAVSHTPFKSDIKLKIVDYAKSQQKLLSDNNIRDNDYFKRGTEPIEMELRDGVWTVKGERPEGDVTAPKGDLGQKRIGPEKKIEGELSPIESKKPITKPADISKPTIQVTAEKISNELRGSVVGSVATGSKNPRDIDILIDKYSPETESKMTDMGYEYRGGSVVSPKEAQASGKAFGEGWSVVHHFEDSSGKKVDLWTKDTSEVDNIKALPEAEEGGATFNADLTKFEGKGVVVSIDSENIKQSELTQDRIQKFVDKHKNLASIGEVKVGIYKFPGSDRVSIDLNVVVPSEHKSSALEFAKSLGQESIFDLEKMESIKTGESGETPVKFSEAELGSMIGGLSKGEFIKPTTEIDVYSLQSETAEPLISSVIDEPDFKHVWRNNVWRYKLENAGDILRELSKYKNTFLDPGYIFEKVNKIGDFLKKAESKDLHYDDSFESAAKFDSPVLAKLKEAYQKLPTMSRAQEVARQLTLSLIDGDIQSAKLHLEFFEQIRGSDDVKKALMEANSYAPSVRFKAETDLVKNTYYEQGLTRSKSGNYEFFHVSQAGEKSLSKGIDSRKFHSTRTSRQEKGLQYGVASFYTKPTDSERMVSGEKFVVSVKPEQVYPIDTDPRGFRKAAEERIPEGTPFREEAIKRDISEQAREAGFKMVVGEWYFDRSGRGQEKGPAFRADALEPMVPRPFDPGEEFTSGTVVAHPDQGVILSKERLDLALTSAVDHFNKNQTYGEAYLAAKDIMMYGGIREEGVTRPVSDADIEMIKMEVPKRIADRIAQAIASKTEPGTPMNVMREIVERIETGIARFGGKGVEILSTDSDLMKLAETLSGQRRFFGEGILTGNVKVPEKIKSGSLVDKAEWLYEWSRKKNKDFKKGLENMSDEQIVTGLANTLRRELDAWEGIHGEIYRGFYDFDIGTILKTDLHKFALQRYGRELTRGEEVAYHVLSGFASPSENPKFDSQKGLEIFDRMMLGDGDGIPSPYTKEPKLDEKGKQVVKGGVPQLTQVGPYYATDSLLKYNELLTKRFKGDKEKLAEWLTTKHSYEELSDVAGKPLVGPKAKRLATHEYLTEQDGGHGIFVVTGPKLGSYILNRIGDMSTVTKDLWWTRWFNRATGQAMTAEGQVIGLPPAASTKKGLRIRRIADEAFGIVAREMDTTPADVQQKIWDFEQKVYQMMGHSNEPKYASEGFAAGAKKLLPEFQSVHYLTDKTGKIYGFTHEGKIYLSSESMDPNVAIHEAGEIWTEWASKERPDLYNAGLEKVVDSPYLEEVKGSSFYQEQTKGMNDAQREDYMRREALNRAIGDEGAKFVDEAKKSSFKQWLAGLWNAIAEMAGIRGISAEEVSKMSLKEFARRVVADVLSPPKDLPKPQVKSDIKNVSDIVNSEEGYKILDSDKELEGTTWSSGGCYVCARAIQRVFGGELITIENNKGIAQHVVVKIGDKYVDSDGVSDLAAKINTQRDELVSGPRAVQFNKDKLGVIPIGSEETVTRLANLLQEPGTKKIGAIEVAQVFDDISKHDSKFYGSGTVPATINPLFPLQGALKLINRAQDLTIGKASMAIEDWMAKMENKALRSSSYSIRAAAQAMRNLIGGLPYTQSDLSSKLKFSGGKNTAAVQAKIAFEEWYKIIDKDPGSLARVHAAMDPEVYKNDPALSKVTQSSLNPRELALMDQLRRANDFIHDWVHDRGLISDQTYQRYKDKYIARMYEEFEMMPDDVQQQMKSGSADLTFLYRRDANPQAAILRDPVYATAKRMGQVLQVKAIFEYADAIVSSKNVQVSDTEFPGSVQLGQPGSRPYYGALTGKYVPQYIAEDFRGFFFSNHVLQNFYDFAKTMDRMALKQFLKKSKTVYAPVVQLGNFAANYSMAFWSGIDPITFSVNQFRAISEIRSKGKLYMEALQNGVISSDILLSDLQSVAPRNTASGVLGSTVGKMVDMETRAADWISNKMATTPGLSHIRNMYNSVTGGATRLYSGVDDIAKLSGYISNREAGYSVEDAARRTYEGFQNYLTVGKMYDAASKTPIIGNPYIKFKADLARMMKNAITRRPLNTALYLAMLYMIKEWLSGESGEDPAVKAIRENRSFVPKVATPFGDIPLVWQTPFGEVNMARFMAPYYAYDKGGDDTYINSLSEWLPYQVQWGPGTNKDTYATYIEMPDVLWGTIAQVVFDTDFRGKSVKDPQGNKYHSVAVSGWDQTMNAIHFLMRSQVPFFRSADDLIAAMEGRPDYYNRIRDVRQAMLNNVIKIQEFGSEEAQAYIVREIDSKVDKMTSIESDLAFLAENYAKELMRIDQMKVSDEAKSRERRLALEGYVRNSKVKQDQLLKLMVELTDKNKLFSDLAKAQDNFKE